MASTGGCMSCKGQGEVETGKEKKGRRSVHFSTEGVQTGEHGDREPDKMKDKGEVEREGRKVMVAVDEGEASIEALRWAASNIVRGKDTVILLHAQHPPPISTGHMVPGSVAGIVAGSTAAKNFQTEMLYEEARSRELMTVWKEFCSSQNVEAKALVRMGEAGDVICETTEEYNVDLLVVGSHGYGPIKRALLGSVSDYVVHHAKCPVVVVKKRD